MLSIATGALGVGVPSCVLLPNTVIPMGGNGAQSSVVTISPEPDLVNTFLSNCSPILLSFLANSGPI